MSWKRIRLEDIADFSNGINFDKSAYAPGVKLIGVSDFKERFSPDYSELCEVKNDIVRDTDYLIAGDIIFVRSNGNKELVGRCMLIKNPPVPVTFSGFCIRARIRDFDKYDPTFFAYHFKHAGFRKVMMGTSVGANIQNLSQKRLSAYSAPIPDIKTQHHIADILSTYDNLIENNQKQIKLLEEAAQRLFKEWFVDLRFPGYETIPVVNGVPKGWELCRLENAISFNPKVLLNKERLKQSIPMSALSTTSMVLDAGEFTTTFSNSGSKFQNSDTLLARITPCLENGKTAFVSGIESEEGAVGSTEYIVMRSKGINPYMVYLLARTDSFRKSAINSMTGSDGRQRAQVDKLKVLPYLKPASHIIKLFARYVEPIFIQIQKKNEQNIGLRQARDRLLPKLMSGEIEV